MSLGSRARRSLVSSILTVCLFTAFILTGRPAHAQAPAVLLPGSVNPNLAAVGFVAKQTPTIYWETGTGRDLATTSSVAFGRLDAHTQSMKVYAWKVASGVVDFVAGATGRLQLDFCVPRPGADACDSDPDPAAPDIPVSITFGYGLIGRVHALGLGTSAGFQATASVIDIERKTYVNYQELANLSASLGTVKVIAKIPIPIPDYESAEITSPVTFTTLIKRGKRYRFMLSAASWADASWQPFSYAVSDFSTTTEGTMPAGLILLRDLTIHVSSDVSDLQHDVTVLQETVSSLQEQVGALAAQVEALANANQEDNSVLRAEMQAIPAGPAGPAGPTGTQGPPGATGAQGEGLAPGSLLMLPAGSPAPAGYTREGTFDLAPSGEPRGRQKLWRVDVYVRQATN